MKKELKHYFSILEEEKKPNYLKTKKQKPNDEIKQKHLELLPKKNQKNISETNSTLELKTKVAQEIIKNCQLCHRRCGVNRKEKETGYCGVPATSRYSDQFIHRGEEPELVPSHTIFFSGCTFKCKYCQNWRTSTTPKTGTPLHPDDLAKKIIRKNLKAAKNVNLVGGEPTPHLHYILKTLNKLEINTPIIWNSNMYMSKKSMKLLEDTIDLYLADFKYGNNKCAKNLSDAKEYTETIKRNLKTAKKQSNILIRHLALPNHIECCTKPMIEWVTKELGNETRFNLMFQYRSSYRAKNDKELNRPLNKQEKQRALEIAKENNLTNLVGH